jgi:hypothetical protein
MDMPNLTWKSPIEIDEMDGYILAVIVRLVSTGKTFNNRTPADAASVLTEDKVDRVAKTFAFIKNHVKGVKDPDEFADKVQSIREERADAWCKKNKDKVNEAVNFIYKMIELPGRPGFSCYG